MKKSTVVRGFAITALAALCIPVLSAQGGGGAQPPGTKPAPTSPVTGNAANGKQFYFSYSCYACHGYGGETGQRAFVGYWGNLSDEQTFIKFLRGRANIAPATPFTGMPCFPENTMSDQRAKDIYAYIRSFKSTSPQVKDIPTLNAILEAAKSSK